MGRHAEKTIFVQLNARMAHVWLIDYEVAQ